MPGCDGAAQMRSFEELTQPVWPREISRRLMDPCRVTRDPADAAEMWIWAQRRSAKRVSDGQAAVAWKEVHAARRGEAPGLKTGLVVAGSITAAHGDGEDLTTARLGRASRRYVLAGIDQYAGALAR